MSQRLSVIFIKGIPEPSFQVYFINTQVGKDFPFLLLPCQGYHLRTGHQVRGCSPLALSKHCVCSGLWLRVVGSPPVCLPGGMGLAREKEKMVLFVWRNGTKFLLYLTLLAMCDIPPLLQNKYQPSDFTRPNDSIQFGDSSQRNEGTSQEIISVKALGCHSGNLHLSKLL